MHEGSLFAHGWPCPTAAQMQEIDRHAIEKCGLPARLLMENAGRAVAFACLSRYPQTRRPLVLCGAGNNGGDGFVVARTLADAAPGLAPCVVSLGDAARHSSETAANRALLVAAGIDVHSGTEVNSGMDVEAIAARAQECDLVIDAVFGVGLTRAVDGPLRELFERLSARAESGAPVVSVDVPSGVSSDSGAAVGAELRSDLIVTLGLPKLGLALRRFDAEVQVADIGFPTRALSAVQVLQWLSTPHAIARLLPPRPASAHKGRFGHALVVGGSTGKTGAAVLAAIGALRSGAGLVTVAAPRTLHPVLETKLTEAMTVPVDDTGRGQIARAAAPALLAEARRRDVLVIGPGLGTDPETVQVVHALLDGFAGPALVDADALNAFAGRPESLRGGGPRVCTPHPGEAGRLLGRSAAAVESDRAGSARELAARTQACVVLKGTRTLVAAPSGELIVNPTGGPGLASGGSGDVLSGVIGALLAQGLSPLDAAATGVYLHGAAGEASPVGQLASDVAARIPGVWRTLVGIGEEQEPIGVLRAFTESGDHAPPR